MKNQVKELYSSQRKGGFFHNVYFCIHILKIEKILLTYNITSVIITSRSKL